jgi:hypothetical protein
LIYIFIIAITINNITFIYKLCLVFIQLIACYTSNKLGEYIIVIKFNKKRGEKYGR